MSYYREPARRPKPAPLRDSACGICLLDGPDEFGNYDLIENDRCPIHGAAAEDRQGVRRGSFGRMLEASKEDRDAA